MLLASRLVPGLTFVPIISLLFGLWINYVPCKTSAFHFSQPLLVRSDFPAHTIDHQRYRLLSISSALRMANEKLGIFFGTSTGSTQDVADMIAGEFDAHGEAAAGPVDVETVKGKVKDEFFKYNALIVGTPTWNTGADTERSGTAWDEIYYGEMQDLALAGKKVAVFGLGDQVSYAENYADATGELHDVFESLGSTLMGYTSQEGYEHEESKSIRGDKFCGLLCDVVNQEDLTEGRVKNWVAQLISEGILEESDQAPTSAISPVRSSTRAVEATETEPLNLVSAGKPSPPFANGAFEVERSRTIDELERENDMLRKLLESNGASFPSEKNGFDPHTNKFGRTMWTSSDGRSCYYT